MPHRPQNISPDRRRIAPSSETARPDDRISVLHPDNSVLALHNRRHPVRTPVEPGVNNIRQLRMWSVTQIRRWHGATAALSFRRENRPAITIVSTDQTNSAAVARIFSMRLRGITASGK